MRWRTKAVVDFHVIIGRQHFVCDGNSPRVVTKVFGICCCASDRVAHVFGSTLLYKGPGDVLSVAEDAFYTRHALAMEHGILIPMVHFGCDTARSISTCATSPRTLPQPIIKHLSTVVSHFHQASCHALCKHFCSYDRKDLRLFRKALAYSVFTFASTGQNLRIPRRLEVRRNVQSNKAESYLVPPLLY